MPLSVGFDGEMLATAPHPGAYWYTVKPTGSDGYRTAFVSDSLGILAQVGVVREAPGSSERRIYAAGVTGRVRFFSATDKRELGAVQLQVRSGCSLQAVEAVDLFGGPAPEFVGIDCQLALFSSSGQRLAAVDDFFSTSLVLGQMDGDADLEVAVDGGWVFDLPTLEPVWRFAEYRTLGLSAADLDHDGNLELVGTYLSSVYAWDVEARSELWTLGVQSRGKIGLGNLDDDRAVEVVFDGPGGVNAYDTSTLLREWVSQGDTTKGFAVQDLDGDGVKEIFWSAGGHSSGPDYLHATNGATGKPEWRSLSLRGPFLGPEEADVDCDGEPELVVAAGSQLSGADPAAVLVLDPVTLAIRTVLRAGDRDATRAVDLRVRDVDRDGCAEILFAGSHTHGSSLDAWKFRGDGFKSIGRKTFDSATTSFTSVEGIGNERLRAFIAGVSDPAGAYIAAFDARDGRELWRTTDGSPPATALRVGNTDRDPAPELLALKSHGSLGELLVLDARTGEAEFSLEGAFTDLSVAPSYGSPLIRLAGNDGVLTTMRFEQGTYVVVDEQQISQNPIHGFAVRSDTIWYGSDRRLYRYRNGTTDWQSGDYSVGFGRDVLAPSTGGVLASGLYGTILFTTGSETP